ncbi:hypothetical protein [Nisaea nitritireducens]|uniref:hypothetical protein n=1 Tax=Nisaea nitritireducens TaxID=568392 RepID=UPI001867D7F7|nr:hypothetical protein [Nisaea nitritireducens]
MVKHEFIGIHGQALRQQIECLLGANGYDVLYSDDMERYVAEMDRLEAFVHPRFRAAHNDQSESRFIAIMKDDRFCGMIAWTVIETHSYERLLRDGTAFVRDPWAHDWKPMNVRLPEKIAGRIHFRGGLRVVDQGNRFSWFLTSLHEAFFHDDRADYLTAHATPEIVASGLPAWLYGYHHRFEMPRHRLSWEGRWNNLSILWSTPPEIAHNVEIKTMFLRRREDDDLLKSVGVFKRLHVAEV